MPVDPGIYAQVQPQPSTLQTLGAISALKGQQQQQQIGALELQQKTRQMAAETALNNAMSNALDQSGNIDESKLQQGLVGTPAASQWPAIQQHLSSLREAKQKMAAAEADHVGSLAAAADAAGDDPHDKAGVLLAGIASGVQDGSIPRDHGQAIIQNIMGPDGNPDPAAVTKTIATMRAKSQEQAKLANAVAIAKIRANKGLEQKPGVVGGQQVQGVFDPNTGKTTVAGQDVTGQFQPPTTALTAEQQLQKPLVEANTAKAKAEADQLTALNGVTGPASQFPDVQPGQKNEPFLASLPGGTASQVKLMAEGKLAVPSGAALRSPYWQGLLQATAKYDPTFDAVNYNARNKTRLAFTSGKEAGQVNAINTAIGHLDKLSQNADALSNFHEGTFGPLTTTVNEAKNAVVNASGSSRINNFNITRKAVADELTRVWRQAGGSEADIQENLKNLSSAGTPENLHGAVATFGDLLESKLASLGEQYRQGMGTDKVDILTPQSRATLSRLEEKAGKPKGSLTANLPSAAPAQTAPTQGGTGAPVPAAGATIQRFGATYKWDGSHYVKQ